MEMKNLIRNVFIALAVFAAASCAKDDAVPAEDNLTLTPHNVAGVWELIERNGSPLGEGTYAYLELTWQDRKFFSYDKFDSFHTVSKTGVYDIYEDENAINGIFDNSYYETWKHKYVVTSLTSTRMAWTAADDASITRVYARIDALPEGIASAATAE